jgi:two-component system chemotaxis response regulator CheY
MLNILIVEDEESSRLLLKSFLAAYGTCHMAEDGGKAVGMFSDAVQAKKRFDLVVLDVRLPVMDGMQVLKTIRRVEQENNIDFSDGSKVIMCTALSDHKSVLEAFREQCEIYLVKPVEKAKLIENLRKLKLIE